MNKRLYLLAAVLAALLSVSVQGCGGGGGGHSGGVSNPPPVNSVTTVALNPMSVDIRLVQGGLVPLEYVTISTGIAGVGSAAVPWTVSVDRSWLSLHTVGGSAGYSASGSGSGEGVVFVNVDNSLAPGAYTGHVSFTIQGVPTTLSIPVTLTIVPAPTTGVAPLGLTQPERALFRSSVTQASLQDQLVHTYDFPGITGTSYSVALDTNPSGAKVFLYVVERTQGGATLVQPQVVTTPFVASFSATVDSRIALAVYDLNQANLTLSSLIVTPTSGQSYDPSGFDVILHITGDAPFVGLGYANDLATASDRTAFATALGAAINANLPPSVRIRKIGIDLIPSSVIAAIDPSLVSNGLTILPQQGPQADAVTVLGAPASDPMWGKALDVFLTRSNRQTAQGGELLGFAPVAALDAGGGTFVGNGPLSAIFMPMFVGDTPQTIDTLGNTLAHEIGHFLGLRHTTESTFKADDLPDTPFTPKTNDLDGNGIMDLGEEGPDVMNLMFWSRFPGSSQAVVTTQQARVMQDYLSIREH